MFAEDPVNLIKIFWLAGREDLLFHPDALKQMHRSLRLIDRKLRADPRANAYFLEILTSPKSVERILQAHERKRRAGQVRARFRQDRLADAVQHVSPLHGGRAPDPRRRRDGGNRQHGGLKKELPLTHELLPQLNDVRLLYVALFLHDIAKGRDEDHSLAGARIARRFCPRLGLTAAETDTVAWLIEYHLLMSEVAQSRDIQDPETARQFADVVQSPNRLALLMILTACDIRAVGPGVWTGWKGSLLRSLYYATEPLLSGGIPSSASPTASRRRWMPCRPFCRAGATSSSRPMPPAITGPIG